MTPERYNELMSDDTAKLSHEEMAAGWHFCPDWDDLLVGPGMPEAESCVGGCNALSDEFRPDAECFAKELPEFAAKFGYDRTIRAVCGIVVRLLDAGQYRECDSMLRSVDVKAIPDYALIAFVVATSEYDRSRLPSRVLLTSEMTRRCDVVRRRIAKQKAWKTAAAWAAVVYLLCLLRRLFESFG